MRVSAAAVKEVFRAVERYFLKNKVLITAGIGIVVALALIFVSYSKATTVVEPIRRPNGSSAGVEADKTLGETAWRDVRFAVNDNPLAPFLLSVATGILAAVAFQLVSSFVENKINNAEESRFEEFFGRGAASRSSRGRIILQADDIGELMSGLMGGDSKATGDIAAALKRPEGNRLYKARHWVNARDAESAKIIREGFRQMLLPAPELHIIGHDKKGEEAFKEHAAAPYVISMGLGFSETTMSQVSVMGIGGVYIALNTKMGDGLAVRREMFRVYSDADIEPVDIVKEEEATGYQWMRVKGWDHTDWMDRKDGVKDYAVIIRRVVAVEGGRFQVRLILGGFTEDGTAAAGRYLVKYWPELRARYVAGADGPGEFVLLVSGDANATVAWSNEPSITLDEEALRTGR